MTFVFMTKERTLGSETSQYQKEQKTMLSYFLPVAVRHEEKIVQPIPQVAASEKGEAQTTHDLL